MAALLAAAWCRLEHNFAASGERDASTHHCSFGHGDSGEVAMCLSAQAVPFLRKSSEGGGLVNMQLTGAPRKGRSLVSIGISLSLLT